jgi:hypothetical protein
VTGRADPLPTTMDEGSTEVKLPTYEVAWLDASESTTQSVTAGSVKALVLKEVDSNCWSHAPV